MATLLVRNGGVDVTQAIYEQFGVFEPGAPTQHYARLVENLGPLAATAGAGRDLEVWATTRGPVPAGTYQAIGETNAEHMAGATESHRGIFVLTVSYVENSDWIARQLALAPAVLDLTLLGWLLRRSVVEACKTAYFRQRCLLEHTPTYCNDVAEALANGKLPPDAPDFDVWLRDLIAEHGESVVHWGVLYCAALLRELTAHGRRRRHEEPSMARVVANWHAYEESHPGPHLLRVDTPTETELARYERWMPVHGDEGVVGKKGGVLTYEWDWAAQLVDNTRFEREEVAFERFTVQCGELSIVDARAFPNQAGRTTVVRAGETACLVRGFTGKLKWKGRFVKAYAYFNDAGQQLGLCVGGTTQEDTRCDECNFHCEVETYLRTIPQAGKRRHEVVLCRICYLRFGPGPEANSEAFVRSRYGEQEDVTDAERAAIAALKQMAKDAV